MSDKTASLLPGCDFIDVLSKGMESRGPAGPVFCAFRPHPNPEHIGDMCYEQLFMVKRDGGSSSGSGGSGGGGSREELRLDKERIWKVSRLE